MYNEDLVMARTGVRQYLINVTRSMIRARCARKKIICDTCANRKVDFNSATDTWGTEEPRHVWPSSLVPLLLMTDNFQSNRLCWQSLFLPWDFTE